MFCKTCEYPLWNIDSRTCPECGSGYKPSDFEFTPESVRFLCPHCRQEYYGTDTRGHLAPRAFDCVNCNAAIDMDEMVLIPREGVDEHRTRADVVPWLDRKRIGFFKGWFGTIGMSIGSPTRLARAMPITGGTTSAMWYCAFTQTVFGTAGMAVLALLPLSFAFGFGGGSISGVVIGIVVSVLGMLIGLALSVALWGLIAHAILRITGSTRAGLGCTISTICYASGANFLSAVPCLGFYIAWLSGIWWAIAGAIMVSVKQEVSGWRAAFAVAVPPLVIGGAAIGLLVWWMISLSSAMSGVMSGSWYANTQSQTLFMMLKQHATSTGSFPTHAGELIGPVSFVDSSTFQADINALASGADPFLGTTSLDDLAILSATEINALAIQEAAAMPANVIAHAVGDFVFTYHGLDPDLSDGGLWVFVAFGPPDFSTNSMSPSGVFTGTGPPSFILATQIDGTTIELTVSNWTQDLATQNALRAAEGLPALPDLQTVTPDKPAVSGGDDGGGGSP